MLAKEFGGFHKLNVSDCFSALKAINVNKINFLKRIDYLSKCGINYQIIADDDLVKNQNEFIEKRKISNIYIVPSIFGSGEAVAQGMGMVATNAAGQAVLTTTGQVVATLINAAITAAISVGISFIATALTKSGQPVTSNLSFGGGESAIESNARSYIFSNYENSVSQGAGIPIGYGKTKTSSKVIWNTVKNYSTSQVFENEFNLMQNLSLS